MKRMTTDLEHQHQAALIAWCELSKGRHPELAFIFAIPNGGWRNPVVAAKLKAEGVRPGVPDLFLPVALGGYYGLFIELKRPKSILGKAGKASTAQSEWIGRLREHGYRAEVCEGYEAARDVLLDYISKK